MKQAIYQQLVRELDAKRRITLKRAREIYGAPFSDSTWKRLKKMLKESYGCALRWDAKGKVFKVPATWTLYVPSDDDGGKRDQLAVLRAAASRVGPPFSHQIAALLDKLDHRLAKTDPNAADRAPVGQPVPRARKSFYDMLQRIDGAIRRHHIATIKYRKSVSAKVEERSIAPYEIHNYLGRFYVWATDEGGSRPKFFALDRIEDLKVEEDDTFDRDSRLSIDDELRHSFGVWVGSGKPQDIEVEISEARAADVFARRWPAEKSSALLPNGRLRITFSVSDPREVVAWVLGFGGEAWIREPASAARLAWELAQKTASEHSWARDVPVDDRLMRFEWGADGLPLQRPKLSRL
jgi:predicted DNA-binding transcriptional regulator YafY